MKKHKIMEVSLDTLPYCTSSGDYDKIKYSDVFVTSGGTHRCGANSYNNIINIIQ